jgi:lysophospholipase L1-like esterase
MVRGILKEVGLIGLRTFVRKKRRLSGKYYLTYNLGIPGQTTQDLIARYKDEIAARLDSTKDSSQCVFAFGMNDIIVQDGKILVGVKSFKSNISEVIEWSLKVTTKPILVNIPPIDVAASPDKILGRTLENIVSYNHTIEEIAQTYDITVVDIYSLLIHLTPTEYLDQDCLHPNDFGHEVIYTEVKKAIEMS